MSRQSTIISTSFLLSCLLLCTYSFIFTNSSQPPAGHTNSPVDGQTCAKSNCHSGSAQVDNSGFIDLDIGTNPQPQNNLDGFSYTPGKTYNLLVDLTALQTSEFGFQLSTLGPNNNQAGSFSIINSGNTSLQTQNNIEYIGHQSAGGNATWLVEWTAPAAGSGAVTFYVAANGANGDGTNNGDDIYIKDITISEDINCSLSASLASAGGDTVVSLCQGDSATLSAFVSDTGTGNYIYDWSGIAAADSSITVSSAGSYQVTVTDTSSGCSDTSNTLDVSVQASPSEPMIQQNGDTLVATGVSDSVSYQWLRGGNPISNATDSLYLASQDGNYAVRVSNPNGCSSTSQTVNVTNTSVSPHNDNRSITLQRLTRDVISVHLDDQTPLQLTLYDLSGRILYSTPKQSRPKGEHRFDLPAFEARHQIVLIRLTTEQGVLSRKIFVK
jgi:hypothetical protein